MTREDWPTTAAGSPPSSSKDDGKRAFIESRFSDALGHYLTAIDQLIFTSSSSSEGASASSSEHQILLSNVVACRLKIGGTDMIEKAVGEAKKCVSLNPQWSKAHVRLASAYIALGGHSNDACLSLQRALSLDRTNKVAREMLVKEMRRRTMEQSGGNTSSSSSSSSTTTTNSEEARRQQDNRGDGDQVHPIDGTSHRIYPGASAPPSSESANNNNQSSHDGIDIDDTESPINVQQHNSLSTLFQRIQHYIARFITWFYSQSEDFQTLIMVSFCFLILYVALGGRFGLGGALPPAGNYGKGNAYDRYSSSRRGSSSSSSNSDRDHYQDGRGGRRTTTSSHSTEYNDRTYPQNDKYYARYGNTDDYYYDPPRGRQNNRGYNTSFQLPNLHDGSLISMTILLIGGMICHRFGVNPFQVLMMLNLLNRRGGGARFGYGAYPGGGAGGFGRFGGGFGRQRYGFGRRGRGGGYW